MSQKIRQGQILNYIKSFCVELFKIFLDKIFQNIRQEIFQTIPGRYMLNYFKYFGTKGLKKLDKKTI